MKISNNICVNHGKVTVLMALTTPFRFSMLFWEGGVKKLATPHLSPPPPADKVRLVTGSPATAPVHLQKQYAFISKQCFMTEIKSVVFWKQDIFLQLFTIYWCGNIGTCSGIFVFRTSSLLHRQNACRCRQVYQSYLLFELFFKESQSYLLLIYLTQQRVVVGCLQQKTPLCSLTERLGQGSPDPARTEGLLLHYRWSLWPWNLQGRRSHRQSMVYSTGQRWRIPPVVTRKNHGSYVNFASWKYSFRSYL